MKLLYRTTDQMQMIYAKAILEGQDINCFELDVHMSALEGGIGAFPKRLMVADDDFAQARRILLENDFSLEAI